MFAKTAQTPIYVCEENQLDALKKTLTPEQAHWLETTDFTAKLGTRTLLPATDGQLSGVVFGWGDAKQRATDRLHLGKLPMHLPHHAYTLDAQFAPSLNYEQAALGWLLGMYQFTRYKEAKRKPATLAAPQNIDAARLTHIVQGAHLAQDLINTPTNDMSPQDLEDATQTLAQETGAQVNVIVGEDLLAQNYPMIHTVGRASTIAPRLIDLRWGANSGAPKVTLVGKGVCFDTGGLDIKPSSNMRLMKKDMGGAATVLGLASIIMRQKLNVDLRVLIPAVENNIAGNAFRPSDVLQTRKGITVEIGNTDAEGRLILADALTEADSERPDLLIDMATLTGAARVALGTDVMPYFTDDEEIHQGLASIDVEDPLWRLPLWDAYEADLSSKVATTNNISSGRFGGAITAGLFLRKFVEHTPWVHFDLYGWTPKAKPGRPEGGVFQAGRTVFAMLEKRYGY